MRVVLDTNVLLSGIFFGGTPGRILSAWGEGALTLVISPSIFEEYRRAGEQLAEQHGELELSPLLALIARQAEIVDAPELDPPVSRDPEDDKFLACARAADAPVLVSGDDDLLTLDPWEGIRIVSPRAFVDTHLSEVDG